MVEGGRAGNDLVLLPSSSSLAFARSVRKFGAGRGEAALRALRGDNSCPSGSPFFPASVFLFPRFFPALNPAIIISWCFHHLPKAQTAHKAKIKAIHSNTLETVASACTPAASTTATTAPSSARTMAAALSPVCRATLTPDHATSNRSVAPRPTAHACPACAYGWFSSVPDVGSYFLFHPLPQSCDVHSPPCQRSGAQASFCQSCEAHEPCRQSSELDAVACPWRSELQPPLQVCEERAEPFFPRFLCPRWYGASNSLLTAPASALSRLHL